MSQPHDHASSLPDHPSEPSAEQPATPPLGHDFDVQKEGHRQIRNDPDYDDWEYGTEPLPHEAWLPRQRPEAS